MCQAHFGVIASKHPVTALPETPTADAHIPKIIFWHMFHQSCSRAHRAVFVR